MPSIVFNNAEIFLAGYELSAQMNQIALENQAESLDNTKFGDGSRVKQGGLRVSSASGQGFWRSCDAYPDAALFDSVGLADAVAIFTPQAITEGSTSTGVGYMFKITEGSVQFGGAVGELLPFTFALEGRGV